MISYNDIRQIEASLAVWLQYQTNLVMKAALPLLNYLPYELTKLDLLEFDRSITANII